MTNPQGPGKQGRKDSKAKARQPHHEAAGAPGRSEHHQPGQSARGEQSHMQHRPGSSHPSQARKEREE